MLANPKENPEDYFTFNGPWCDLLARCESNLDGSLIYVNGKNFTLEGFFLGAACNNGSIYLNGDGFDIKGCRFEECIAAGDGGAVYATGNGTFTNCWFTDCSSGVDGGAVLLDRDDCVFKNCMFSFCGAGDDGGAIYVCKNVEGTQFFECVFRDCNANDKGYLLSCHCGQEDTFFSGCTFRGVENHDVAFDSGHNTTRFYTCEGIEDNADADGRLLRHGLFFGSSFSGGSLWLIVAIVAVVVCAVVAYVVLKKKKAVAGANNAPVQKVETDEDDE